MRRIPSAIYEHTECRILKTSYEISHGIFVFVFGSLFIFTVVYDATVIANANEITLSTEI